MRTLYPLLAAVILLANLAGCASQTPPRAQSQSDPDIDLAAYSTFGWQSVPGIDGSNEPLRLLDVNIRKAIHTELTRRGYTEVASDPELLIAYDTEARDKLKSSPFRVGIGLGSFGGNVGGSVNVGSPSVQSYQEGQLVIHVVDAAANREVWLGTLTGRVDTTKLDEATVARAVALAMQDFPSRSGSLPPP